MSLHLDGSSQYYDLGVVDVASTTSFTIAAVVRYTASQSGVRSFISQGQYSSNSGWGMFSYSSNPHPIGVYGAPVTVGNTVEQLGSTQHINEGDWVLVIITFYKTGSFPSYTISEKIQVYNYTTLTWSNEEILGDIASNLSDPSFIAPTTEHTIIGAASVGGVADKKFSGDLSWIAVFINQDVGANTTQIKDTTFGNELKNSGFWNSITSDCKLAISFNNTTLDRSSNAYSGTLIGSPSYTDAGPNELGGSTQYNQSVSISIATMLLRQLQVAKSVTSSVSSTESITKQASKQISITESNTLAIAKTSNKLITATINTSVVLLKNIAKTISKIINVAVSNVKFVTRQVVLSVSNSLSLNTNIFRLYTQSITVSISTVLSISNAAVETIVKGIRDIASLVIRRKNTNTLEVRLKDNDEL